MILPAAVNSKEPRRQLTRDSESESYSESSNLSDGDAIDEDAEHDEGFGPTEKLQETWKLLSLRTKRKI